MPAVTPHEVAAWLLVAGGLAFTLRFHLVPALLAGLLVHVLLHRLAGRLARSRLSRGTAKVTALALMAAAASAAVAGVTVALVGFLRGRLGDLPALFATMAETLERTELWLAARGAGGLLPQALRDAAALKEASAGWLRTHAAEIQKLGGELGRGLLHAALGVAIGVLAFFARTPGVRPAGPLAAALAGRLRRLEAAFEAIVLAQVKISAVNTALTGLYLAVALPLAGVRLPFTGTLIGVTFVAGLLPIVGNLASNAVIVVTSLSASAWVAAASLAFLVGIHKLEYVVNARIAGGEIHAAAWEVLLAIVAFEAAFGVAGVVVAPLVYAYAKSELADRGLV
jgi:predicted PurR-regulated permease PerM